MVDFKSIARKLSAVGGQTVTISPEGFSTDEGILWLTEKATTGLDKTVTVSAKLFTSLISKAGSGTTLLKSGDGFLLMESGKLRAKLPIQKESAPVIPSSSLSGLNKSIVPLKTFQDLTEFCQSIAQEKESFDYTSGIRLYRTGAGRIEAAATDNLRIAVASEPDNGPAFDLFIPSKTVRVLKLLEGEQIFLSETESTIVFESGSTTLVAKKLTKKFPDIQNVFPKSWALETTIKIKDLQDSLNRISPALDPETQKVLLTFDGGDLVLSATGDGEAVDAIEIETSDPFSFNKIAANARFLGAGLTSLSGCGTLIFKVNEGSKPFLWETTNRKLLLAGMKL